MNYLPKRFLVALVCLAGAIDILDHTEGAGTDAGTTADAIVIVDRNNATGHVFADSIFWAGLFAPGLIALHAGDCNELGFLEKNFVVDAGSTGGKLAGVLERTGQFAGLAANTFCGIDAYQFLHELPPSRDG